MTGAVIRGAASSHLSLRSLPSSYVCLWLAEHAESLLLT